MVLLTALTAHLIGDFFLQGREIAKQKSENLKALGQHVLTVSLVMYVFLMVVTLDFYYALVFSVANGVIHGLIDWNIWKSYKAYAISMIKKAAQEEASRVRLTLVGKSKNQTRGEKIDILLKAKQNFKFWEDHWFYVTIGVDQWLHAVTIVILWAYLNG